MNSAMMNAFFDELVKIADWSLTGPEAMAQHSGEALAAGGPHGTFSGPDMGQYMQQRQAQTAAQNAASAARESKMEQMLQSGQWNPQTHTVDQAGNLVPKKQHSYPAQQPRVDRSAATNVGGRPAAPAGHVPTQILSKTQLRGGPQVAKAAPGLLRRGLSMAGKAGKVGLGLGAMGLAGAAGGVASQPAPAPAMG